MNDRELRWNRSDDGCIEEKSGRFRIEPVFCGRTRPIGYTLHDDGEDATIFGWKPTVCVDTQADGKAEAQRRVNSEQPVPLPAGVSGRLASCGVCGANHLHEDHALSCPARRPATERSIAERIIESNRGRMEETFERIRSDYIIGHKKAGAIVREVRCVPANGHGGEDALVVLMTSNGHRFSEQAISIEAAEQLVELLTAHVARLREDDAPVPGVCVHGIAVTPDVCHQTHQHADLPVTTNRD